VSIVPSPKARVSTRPRIHWGLKIDQAWTDAAWNQGREPDLIETETTAIRSEIDRMIDALTWRYSAPTGSQGSLINLVKDRVGLWRSLTENSAANRGRRSELGRARRGWRQRTKETRAQTTK
jgi:hypothetical protein